MPNPALQHAYLSAGAALVELAANLRQQGRLNESKLRAREAARRLLDAVKAGASKEDVARLYARATALST